MNDINWSKWASISEIISSIAILITLIYLAVQTRQNTDAMMANTSDTIINTDLQLAHEIIAYPEIGLSMGNEQLSNLERIRLNNFLIALIRTREHQWFQYKNGVLDDEIWESYLTGLRTNLSLKNTRSMWNIWAANGLFNPEFTEVVNDYLETIPLITYVDGITVPLNSEQE